MEENKHEEELTTDLESLPSEDSPKVVTEEVTAEQESLKKELERVRQKGEGRTKLEKLIYTQKRIEQQIREEKEAAGLLHEEVDDTPQDDDSPMTLRMWKEIQQRNAAQSAMQLVEEIPNEVERELTRYHLKNSVKSSGNPQEDLKLARAIVNAAKNQQIIEEIQRKAPANNYSSGSSAPAKVSMDEELTADEISVMRQFKLTKEQVLDARKKELERVARSIPTARF